MSGVSQMGLGFTDVVGVLSCPPSERIGLSKSRCFKKQHVGVHLLRGQESLPNPSLPPHPNPTPEDQTTGSKEMPSSKVKALPGGQASSVLSQKQLKYEEAFLL